MYILFQRRNDVGLHFSHDIFTNESVTFTWAFQPDDFGFQDYEDPDNLARLENVARLYNVQVTNTLSGGATQCLKCPEGKLGDGSVYCLIIFNLK